ncbi:MAG: phosphatidate cytidylyltransferase [Candidatus Hydrogenedentes bacterium]|nr:phosphatidate cytidylyltransferase [Candidatus Hydrogenedentota bacterium]
MRSNQGSTLVRLLTAIVMLPVVLALVWIPQLEIAFVAFIALLVAIGLSEFFAIAYAKKIATQHAAAVFFGVLMVVAAYNSPAMLNAALVLGVIVAAWIQVLRSQVSLTALSVTLWGLFYVGWMPAHFVMLHGYGKGLGAGLVTFLIVIIALSDTGAYFVGRAIGRHKLAPTISPKKTWEGAVGGVVVALIGAVVAWYIDERVAAAPLPGWELWHYALTGVLLAIAGQIGDLVESMMKRDAGVKDSGNILPGHGGILDRCDGYLFAGPMLYYLLAWLPASV